MLKTIAGFIVDALLDKLKEERVIEQGKKYAEDVVVRSEKLGQIRESANYIISIPSQFFDGMGFQGTLLKQVIGLQVEKLTETSETVKTAMGLGGGFYKELLDGIQPGELLARVTPFIEEKIKAAAERALAKLGNNVDGGEWFKVNDDQPAAEG